MIRVHTQLSEEDVKVLTDHAKSEGVSREYVIRKACEAFVKNIKKGKK